jgi:hypothetical protein
MECKMLPLEQIREELQDRKISCVSDATGVHANTIRDIRDGGNVNPTLRVILALSAYFEGKKNG